MSQTVLLDTHDTKRRLLQTGLPFGGIALGLAGAAVIMGPHVAGQGWPAVIAGLVLIAWAPRVRVWWTVFYKGHTIRFEHHTVFGDRLYIDDTRITKGAFGYRRTLRGVIRTGEGKGDRISAESEAGLTIFRLRLMARSPDA